jgi:hypothetical protein
MLYLKKPCYTLKGQNNLHGILLTGLNMEDFPAADHSKICLQITWISTLSRKST